jgi:molybdopterin/thiamine biosynthesis adenylyltransferase
MDFSRIRSSIDTDRLEKSTVVIIGVGGARDLACDLTRSGVAKIKLFDPQYVELVNVPRQGHTQADVGLSKVAAAEAELRRINPAIDVVGEAVDFTGFSDAEIDERFGDVDLAIFATDRFAAQARGNEVALRLGIPAIWIGLYAGGTGGEIIFWHRDIDACFRCLCPSRYVAHERALAEKESIDPPSDGATIFDVHLIDAIAGQIAVGLLTRGSDTRLGRLINELGDRNFIQVKLAPGFVVNGRDIVREQLGVSADCDTFLSWNTIVRRDPDRGSIYCPDCDRFRGPFCMYSGTSELRWLPTACMH